MDALSVLGCTKTQGNSRGYKWLSSSRDPAVIAQTVSFQTFLLQDLFSGSRAETSEQAEFLCVFLSVKSKNKREFRIGSSPTFCLCRNAASTRKPFVFSGSQGDCIMGVNVLIHACTVMSDVVTGTTSLPNHNHSATFHATLWFARALVKLSRGVKSTPCSPDHKHAHKKWIRSKLVWNCLWNNIKKYLVKILSHAMVYEHAHIKNTVAAMLGKHQQTDKKRTVCAYQHTTYYI